MRRPLDACAVLLLGGALLVGCGGPPPVEGSDPLGEVFRQQAQEAQLSRIETEGKRLFTAYCATCHGETGAADGQNAFNLDPPPPVFEESLRTHPAAYWREIIEGGTSAVGRSPLCPPRGRTLGDPEVDALLAYLHLLAQGGSAGDDDSSPASGGSGTPGGHQPRP